MDLISIYQIDQQISLRIIHKLEGSAKFSSVNVYFRLLLSVHRAGARVDKEKLRGIKERDTAFPKNLSFTVLPKREKSLFPSHVILPLCEVLILINSSCPYKSFVRFVPVKQ